MPTYKTLSDTILDDGKFVTSGVMFALRDNPIALYSKRAGAIKASSTTRGGAYGTTPGPDDELEFSVEAGQTWYVWGRLYWPQVGEFSWYGARIALHLPSYDASPGRVTIATERYITTTLSLGTGTQYMRHGAVGATISTPLEVNDYPTGVTRFVAIAKVGSLGGMASIAWSPDAAGESLILGQGSFLSAIGMDKAA
jgi:hypothetical protein